MAVSPPFIPLFVTFEPANTKFSDWQGNEVKEKNKISNFKRLILSLSQTRSGILTAQPHTIVKQICFPDGNVLFLSLFSLSKN